MATIGTSGTLMGVSKYLKEKDPNIKIVGVQPGPDMFIPGTVRWPEQFVPKLFERDRLDEFLDVSADDAT